LAASVLARAYFLDKNYEDAAFQFEMVKGGDLPPEVLANIDKFLDAGAAWAVTSYEDAYVHSALKGPSWNLYFQPRYILTNQTFVQAGLAFMRDDTKVKAYASDSWRYALGAYHNFILWIFPVRGRQPDGDGL